MANPQKEDGHVDIANEIVEALAKTHLSGYETQVIFAIFRKTYGWHKKEDWITNTQIAEMTDIAEAHISRTIKILIRKNIIKKNGKKLGIQKDYERWKKLPIGVTSHYKKKLPIGDKKLPIGDKKLPIGVNEVTNRGKKKLPIGVYTKETKETTTKETIQKIPNNSFKNLINSTKEEPRKPNDIEFDFELWSWHGIDQDIKDRWANIFKHVDIEIELMNMREFFKKHPNHEKVIEEKFNDNYAIYIFDWLTRAEKWKLEKLENSGEGKFDMPDTAKGG